MTVIALEPVIYQDPVHDKKYKDQKINWIKGTICLKTKKQKKKKKKKKKKTFNLILNVSIKIG